MKLKGLEGCFGSAVQGLSEKSNPKERWALLQCEQAEL